MSVGWRLCEWWEESAARDSWPTRAAIRPGGSKRHRSADRKEKWCGECMQGVAVGTSEAGKCARLRQSLGFGVALQLMPRRRDGLNIGQVGISVALQGELVHDAVVSVCCQRVVCRALLD